MNRPRSRRALRKSAGQSGARDSVAPAEQTAKLAARGPRNEIKRYPIGHFDIYLGEHWERAVADQTEFLVRTLKP